MSNSTAAKMYVAAPLLALMLLAFAPLTALAAVSCLVCPVGDETAACPVVCFADAAACAASNPGKECACDESPRCANAASGGAPGSTAPSGTSTAGSDPKLTDPLGNIPITGIVARFTNILLGLSGSLSLLMFVWGGFQMITSGGDDKKYAAGKNTLRWAVTGLVVIFGAYSFLQFFLNTLGTAA